MFPETVVIRNHGRSIKPRSCGVGAPTLVIGSVGTSASSDTLDEEVAKARRAQLAGADAVTDHSFYGDLEAYHRALVDNLDIIVSTVACYEFAARHQRTRWAGVLHSEPLAVLESQVLRGVDLITVHASLQRRHLDRLTSTSRLIPTTSKGGGVLTSYMRLTSRDNPYYDCFDDILELFKEHGVTLSLGTTFRPATVCDGWDALVIDELDAMAELVERAIAAEVNVMVEGIGHANVGAIPTFVRLAKSYCWGVPYRVLPMATDAALGYDHISGAIGASVAVAAGADAVTCMSRAEHIGLPTEADLEEAVIATRIAAHCGELMQRGDTSRDRQMSRTRWANGCKGDWQAAIYPDGAQAALLARGRLDDQLIQCGMCGDFCGIAAGIGAVRAQQRAN